METITRVRYSKQENGVLVSPEFLGREFVVLAKINSATNAWKVVKNDGTELTSGHGKTLTLAKSSVKKALQAVGVNFLGEMRTVKPAVKKEEGV